MMETVTRVFLKIRVPKSRQTSENIPVNEFTFSKVADLKPATRLKKTPLQYDMPSDV